MNWQAHPPQTFPRLAFASAIAIAAILSGAILTLWLEDAWIGAFFETAIFALAAVWAAASALSGVAPRLSVVLIPMSVPMAVAGLQLAIHRTLTPWDTWIALLRWAACLAVMFIGLRIGASGPLLSRLRRWLLYFGFILAALAVLQFFTAPGKILWIFDSGYEDGVLGPFVSRDRYSAFVELLLPLALYEAFAGKRVALAYSFMAAALVATVIAGASRAGSILVVTESITALVLLSGSRAFGGRGSGGIALKFVALAVVLTAVVGQSHLMSRFHDPDPYSGRREMLASAIAMVKERLPRVRHLRSRLSGEPRPQ